MIFNFYIPQYGLLSIATETHSSVFEDRELHNAAFRVLGVHHSQPRPNHSELTAAMQFYYRGSAYYHFRGVDETDPIEITFEELISDLTIIRRYQTQFAAAFVNMRSWTKRRPR